MFIRSLYFGINAGVTGFCYRSKLCGNNFQVFANSTSEVFVFLDADDQRIKKHKRSGKAQKLTGYELFS